MWVVEGELKADLPGRPRENTESSSCASPPPTRDVFTPSASPLARYLGCTFTLKYFPLAARAEPIRLACYLGGIPFHDVRMPFEDFIAKRETYPFGQLPVLEVRFPTGEKHVLAQSTSIMRFVGRMGGLYPSDPLEACVVDQVMDAVQDIYALVNGVLREECTSSKLAMQKKLAEETLPKWLGYLERKLEQSGTNCFLGTEITVAELQVHQLVCWLSQGALELVPRTLVDNFPLVKHIQIMVLRHPKVQEYYHKQGLDASSTAPCPAIVHPSST
ncbi:unnamed protein product [Chrysoparadoxa australica]